MTKCSIIIFLFLVSLSTVSQSSLNKPQESAFKGDFFYLNDVTLVTGIATKSRSFFNLDKNQSILGVKKVSVSLLKDLNLKEHDQINFIDFKSGRSGKYTLGKEVYILIFETEMSNGFSREWTFNLVLSNDKTVHDRLDKKTVRNSLIGTGLAYNSNDFEFINGEYARIDLKKAPWTKELSSLFNSVEGNVWSAEISDFKLQVNLNKEAPWDVSIVTVGNKHYLIDPVALEFEGNDKYFFLGKFNTEYMFFISLIYPLPQCSSLNLLRYKELTVKSIHCIPKNNKDQTEFDRPL